MNALCQKRMNLPLLYATEIWETFIGISTGYNMTFPFTCGNVVCQVNDGLKLDIM